MAAGSYVAVIVLAATVKLLANLHIVGDVFVEFALVLVWHSLATVRFGAIPDVTMPSHDAIPGPGCD